MKKKAPSPKAQHSHPPYRGWNPVKRLSHCYCHKLTEAGCMTRHEGWVERWLLKLVPHFDITKTVDVEMWEEHPTKKHYAIPVIEKQTVLYLRRFYLFRSKWFGLNFGDVYLHHIIRSDDDPDPHDHPWAFKGFVLAGGYTDERYWWIKPQLSATAKAIMDPSTQSFKRITKPMRDKGFRLGPWHEGVRPLSFIKRKAEHIHRVRLAEGKTAWTLILTSAYGRDWSFITKKGPVFWRTYLGIPSDVDVGE